MNTAHAKDVGIKENDMNFLISLGVYIVGMGIAKWVFPEWSAFEILTYTLLVIMFTKPQKE